MTCFEPCEGVGDPQLGAGVRAFLADDQPHALQPAFEDVAGQFGDPGKVTDGLITAWRGYFDSAELADPPSVLGR